MKKYLLIYLGFIGSFLLGVIFSPLASSARTYGNRPCFAANTDANVNFSNPHISWPTTAATATANTSTQALTFTGRPTVILPTSVHVNARKSPYLLLILPVARSWAAAGFEVIVVLVFHDSGNIPKAEADFFDVMKKELRRVEHVQVVDFPAPSVSTEVSLSQTVRLFLPILMTDWPNDAYIRLSDSDMMIFKSKPFEPQNLQGIDIYNGDCCWPEVPMHSIGMQRRLWVELFEPYVSKFAPGGEAWTRNSLSAAIMELLKEKFNYTAGFVGHGAKYWGMDQTMAGERVAFFKSKAGVLTTHPMLVRAHWPFTVSDALTECHLAGIGLADLMRLKEVIGPLGEGLDVVAKAYNDNAWLKRV